MRCTVENPPILVSAPRPYVTAWCAVLLYITELLCARCTLTDYYLSQHKRENVRSFNVLTDHSFSPTWGKI